MRVSRHTLFCAALVLASAIGVTALLLRSFHP